MQSTDFQITNILLSKNIYLITNKDEKKMIENINKYIKVCISFIQTYAALK